MVEKRSMVFIFILVAIMILPIFSLQSQSSNIPEVSLETPPGWTDDIRLTNNPEADIYPRIAVHGADVHIVWFGPVIGISEVFYMHSNDSGNTWNSPIQVTNSGVSSTYPNIAIDENGKIHIVWHQARGLSYDIFYSNFNFLFINILSIRRLNI